MTPLVSICTPTFNRRPFISSLIKSVMAQTYDLSRIEWIIVDDGTDKIEDLVCDIPFVKYYKYDIQMTLGKKRNIMHRQCVGDIIVYMDDDDYYPKERVSHAVEKLLKAPPDILFAGSSALYIYFDHIAKIYQFGPYGDNHATAASFAFKKELLQITKYDDQTAVAEEKQFLKNYTIPMVPLDPFKTILVFSHIHNSVDKKQLLDAPNAYIHETTLSPRDFFGVLPSVEPLSSFYVHDLNNILTTYDLGKTSHKPELMKQIQEIIEQRKKRMEPLQEMHDKMMLMRAQYETILENKELFIKALIKQNKELKDKLTNHQLTNHK
jgi:glycosyltransferase involved in cell wall biosynthesis